MLLGRIFFLDNLVATPYHVTLWRDGNVGLSSVGALRVSPLLSHARYVCLLICLIEYSFDRRNHG